MVRSHCVAAARPPHGHHTATTRPPHGHHTATIRQLSITRHKHRILIPFFAGPHAEAGYGDVEMNPFNPDASQTLSRGEQTWQEMFFGFFRYVEAGPGE